ncbi:hypothetical protein ACFXJ8_20510 [Nonomuraea sp. NPDC059194]|uniref:hypothetical protein n=1 Tax=Nonomuraea sp. NPDC059194 TaxID=3346764 RepID=UPI0036B38521
MNGGSLMNADLDRVVAHLAPDPGPGLSDGARQLMHEIMEGDPAPVAKPSAGRWRPGWRLRLTAVGAVAAAVLGATWLGPSWLGLGPDPVAALDIKQEDGYYVITVKDLYADPDNYEAQLQAAGLDISLRVEPVSAAFEGQVFPTSGERYVTEFEPIEEPGDCGKVGGCPVGLKIPIGFKGSADIRLGRAARPGEKYRSITSFDALGEPMHCVPYMNKPVAEVREMLRQRGVTIEEFSVGDPNRQPGNSETKASVPDSYLVNGGSLTEPGKAMVSVWTAPMKEEYVKNVETANGCPLS